MKLCFIGDGRIAHNKLLDYDYSKQPSDLETETLYFMSLAKSLGVDVSSSAIPGAYDSADVIYIESPYPKKPVYDKLVVFAPMECPLVHPEHAENYKIENHKYCDIVFTWNDDLLEFNDKLDYNKYLKINLTNVFYRTIDHDVAAKQDGICMLVHGKGEYSTVEGYAKRLELIRQLESQSECPFDLYGGFWDRNVHPSYRGPVDKKEDLFRRYKFALVVETVFINGLITEKIFDAMKMGCIPIYLGAPNITKYIPDSCFIDIRKFESIFDVVNYIKSMSVSSYFNYLDSIEDWIQYKSYEFSVEQRPRTMINAILDLYKYRKTII